MFSLQDDYDDRLRALEATIAALVPKNPNEGRPHDEDHSRPANTHQRDERPLDDSVDLATLDDGASFSHASPIDVDGLATTVDSVEDSSTRFFGQ